MHAVSRSPLSPARRHTFTIHVQATIVVKAVNFWRSESRNFCDDLSINLGRICCRLDHYGYRASQEPSRLSFTSIAVALPKTSLRMRMCVRVCSHYQGISEHDTLPFIRAGHRQPLTFVYRESCTICLQRPRRSSSRLRSLS